MKHREPPERPLQRDPDGKPLCRMCGGPVKPPRRAWCGDECVELRRQELFPRQYVGKRDHGVCADCGIDVEALERETHSVNRDLQKRGLDYVPATQQVVTGLLEEWLGRRIGRAVGIVYLDRSWWEADHIVPLIEGGGHGLDNLRTLCVWCHRGATKELAGRRADARRGQTRLFD